MKSTQITVNENRSNKTINSRDASGMLESRSAARALGGGAAFKLNSDAELWAHRSEGNLQFSSYSGIVDLLGQTSPRIGKNENVLERFY